MKLTLTLVGFVAVTTLVAGVYLRHALDQFAVEALEARLATAGRLLHDETRGLLRGKAGAEEMARFTRRAAVPTGSRVTVIAPDGLVLGDSDIAPGDLGRLREPQGAAEVRAALDGRVGRDLRTSVSVNAPLALRRPAGQRGQPIAIVGVLRPGPAAVRGDRGLPRSAPGDADRGPGGPGGGVRHRHLRGRGASRGRSSRCRPSPGG